MLAVGFRYILFAFFPLAMAFAAASDLLTMTISNKLALALVAGFAVLVPLVGMDWAAFGLHLAAGAVVLVVAFCFFAAGWIGGGDAKLAAAIALWIGWGDIVEYSTYAALFGGALTLFILVFRRSVLPAFAFRQSWVLRLHDEKEGVPYGVALAAAGLAMYPHTIWLRLLLG